MKKILFVFFSIASVLASCRPTAVMSSNNLVDSVKIDSLWINPTQEIKEELGDTLTNILLNADTVKYLRINQLEAPNDSIKQILPSYVIDSTCVGTLDFRQIAFLQYLLPFSPKSYVVEKEKLEAPFFPNLAFDFAKDDEHVMLIISMLDQSWTVMYDGKTQRRGYGDNAALERFFDYFYNK